VIDANVAWRVVDEEAVLLHAENSSYFGLNQTATILWARLAEHPMTAAQLTDWARKHFSETPASLPDEVSAFLDELVELRLVEGAEANQAAGSAGIATTEPGAVAPVWERPAVERFGELEKLILSGE